MVQQTRIWRREKNGEDGFPLVGRKKKKSGKCGYFKVGFIVSNHLKLVGKMGWNLKIIYILKNLSLMF